METLSTNLKMNSLLSSSDDKYFSVLGRNNSKPFDQGNGQQFSEHFAKADATFLVESGAVDKTEVLSTEVQSDVVLDAEKEDLSPLADIFSGPIVSLANVSGFENVSFITASGSLPPSANMNPESSEAEFNDGTPSIRKSTNPNFDEWESDFAASTRLGDNFAAVESAIGKYAARKEDVDQAQSAILPAVMQVKSGYSSITPTIGEVDHSPSWAGASQKDGQPKFVPAKLLDDNQSDRSLNKFHSDEELSQPTSAKPESTEYRPANLASQLRPGGELKTGVGLNTQDVDVDFAQFSQNKDLKSTISASVPETKSLIQDPKLDPLNLRLANKLETSRTVSKSAKEEHLPEFEAIDEKPVVPRTETSVIVGEKATQTATPFSLINPVTAPTNQKSVSFDWNSPKFAERFATEISDLSVNGDLKKFEINPRNLGRLEVSLIARGTSEIIQIEAENQAARDVIVQHSQAIQEMLKAQGRSDLSVRVDLKDASFGSASEGNGQNLAQQDGTGTGEDRPGPQTGRDSIISADINSEPEVASDEGRYA